MVQAIYIAPQRVLFSGGCNLSSPIKTDLQNDWNSLRFGISRDHGIITSAYMCLNGAFTKSHADKDAVIEYIKQQEEHHLKVSGLDEFKMLLAEAGIEYDEKYLK